jgi:type IV secretory pathway protease TraF
MLRLGWRLAEALGLLGRRLARLPAEAAAALAPGGEPCPHQRARLVRALALILPIALGVGLLLPRLRLVMSPSIPAWVVRVAPGPIRRGDYVMFVLSHPAAGPAPVSVTKQALCLPGDRLTTVETRSFVAPATRDGHYYCEGVLLGVSMPVGPHGRRLAHLRWSGIVPPGFVYVGSPHPRGLDSRYFGLVPIARLTRMARLL